MTDTEDYDGAGGISSHGTTHQDGGTDKIAVDGLLGELAAEQKSAWTKVSGIPATFPIAAHATDHQDGGNDEITVEGLTGELAAVQKSSWIKVSDKPTTFAPPFSASAEIIAGTEAAKAIAPDQLAAAKAAGYFGKFVQVQHAVVTAVVSGTTVLPIDDTIPQITEGVEGITCNITPKNANNLLFIVANINFSCTTGSGGKGAIALFKSADAAALAAVLGPGRQDLGYTVPYSLTHQIVAGGTSEITFRVRFGSDLAGTSYMNSQHQSATRVFGGVSSSTLTIFEYSP